MILSKTGGGGAINIIHPRSTMIIAWGSNESRDQTIAPMWQMVPGMFGMATLGALLGPSRSRVPRFTAGAGQADLVLLLSGRSTSVTV